MQTSHNKLCTQVSLFGQNVQLITDRVTKLEQEKGQFPGQAQANLKIYLNFKNHK